VAFKPVRLFCSPQRLLGVQFQCLNCYLIRPGQVKQFGRNYSVEGGDNLRIGINKDIAHKTEQDELPNVYATFLANLSKRSLTRLRYIAELPNFHYPYGQLDTN
jgi:hypothetical protein